MSRQPAVTVPHVSRSWEVGQSLLSLIRFNNICSCGETYLKLLGFGLTALNINISNLFSELLR